MNGSGIGILMALFMEAFVSIHMSVFVLLPLSKMISKENSKKTFWIMFGIRAFILLFFDFFITTGICIVDFVLVFVGAFIVVPLTIGKNSAKNRKAAKEIIETDKVLAAVGGQDANAPGTPVESDAAANKTAANAAGEEEAGVNSVDATTVTGATMAAGTPGATGSAQPRQAPVKKAVSGADFDPLFSMSEDDCLEEFIKREMSRAGIAEDQKLIPEDMLRRKNILSVIFAILLFVYVCLIFFHFPFATYVEGLLILVVYGFLTGRYKLLKYLKKEVKARPQEKISNIVMNVKTSLVPDYSKKLRLGLLAAAAACALLLFVKPRIFYEQTTGGVNVRFYAYGITNMTKVTIPDTYNGEKVVGLRGNTFSNMLLLREVNLPDTITEIRGEAFKGCRILKKVNLPANLEYLGGGAFYNCSRLQEIDLPDSLNYLGGEAFYGCSSLKEIILPEGIAEIRGNTFEECTDLRMVKIPDSVTRIGGHAFYGDSSLEYVLLSPGSKLQEIGSSAFRCCDSLTEITLPRNVYINERAFKETPLGKIYYYD